MQLHRDFECFQDFDGVKREEIRWYYEVKFF